MVAVKARVPAAMTTMILMLAVQVATSVAIASRRRHYHYHLHRHRSDAVLARVSLPPVSMNPPSIASCCSDGVEWECPPLFSDSD
eukprot:12200351-Alexandrium_andersonii.AAC.1